MPSFVKSNEVALEMARVLNREKGIDLESLYCREAENKFRFFSGSMAKCIGEILLNIGDGQILEAEKCIKRAIAEDRGNGMKWHLARDYGFYSELLQKHKVVLAVVFFLLTLLFFQDIIH